MKYIKHFNEDVNLNEESDLIQDIKEICYDITDDDKFFLGNRITHGTPLIFIRKNQREIYKKSFKFEEVKETMLRLKSYLGDIYLKFAYKPGATVAKEITLNEYTEIKEEIFMCIIYLNIN